jgi:hypothetical protein
MIDQIAYELNELFNDTITVNASMRAKVENSSIVLFFDITFQSSDVTGATITKLCQYLKEKLQQVSAMHFQPQCVLPSGTSYSPGNTVTLKLLSEPMNDKDSGATGLVSSVVVIGFFYLLHYLFKNL